MELETIRDLAEIKAKTQSNTERIDKADEEIGKLKDKTDMIHTINTNIERLCLGLSYTNEKLTETNDKLEENANDVKSVKQEITELKTCPDRINSEKWKKAVGYIGTALGSGILMYLLAQLFPQIFK